MYNDRARENQTKGENVDTRNGQGARMVAIAKDQGKTGEPGMCIKCGKDHSYTWDTNYGIQTACEACGWEFYYSLGD